MSDVIDRTVIEVECDNPSIVKHAVWMVVEDINHIGIRCETKRRYWLFGKKFVRITVIPGTDLVLFSRTVARIEQAISVLAGAPMPNDGRLKKPASKPERTISSAPIS